MELIVALRKGLVGHGGDLLCLGDEDNLWALLRVIQAKYEVTSHNLRPGGSIEYLGRTVRWGPTASSGAEARSTRAS